jgi:hypothetical protein
MKIIGLTHNAYLVEMMPRELRDISGNENADQSWSSPNPRLHGATLEINATWEHLRRIQSTDKERAQIAQSLNAAATLIANTPLVLTLPVPPPTSDTQERIEA